MYIYHAKVTIFYRRSHFVKVQSDIPLTVGQVEMEAEKKALDEYPDCSKVEVGEIIGGKAVGDEVTIA